MAVFVAPRQQMRAKRSDNTAPSVPVTLIIVCFEFFWMKPRQPAAGVQATRTRTDGCDLYLFRSLCCTASPSCSSTPDGRTGITVFCNFFNFLTFIPLKTLCSLLNTICFSTKLLQYILSTKSAWEFGDCVFFYSLWHTVCTLWVHSPTDQWPGHYGMHMHVIGHVNIIRTTFCFALIWQSFIVQGHQSVLARI